MKRVCIILTLVLIISVVFAGCGADPYISMDEAKEAVAKKADGGKVETISLESVDGFKVYTGTATKGSDTWEFQVDAESGTVVSWLKNGEEAKVAPVPEEEEEIVPVANNTEIVVEEEDYLNSSAAQAIVSAEYPSAFIEGVNLIEDGESHIYEVTITDGGEPFTVMVDGDLGTIITDTPAETEE